MESKWWLDRNLMFSDDGMPKDDELRDMKERLLSALEKVITPIGKCY